MTRYICTVCGAGGASGERNSGPPTYNCAAKPDGCGGKATMWPAELAEQYVSMRKENDGLRLQCGGMQTTIDELESGLRIVAVSAKGTTLAGLKMVAKQTLNRAFGSTAKCKQCGGSGTRLIYSVCGPVQKACECRPAAKDGAQ